MSRHAVSRPPAAAALAVSLALVCAGPAVAAPTDSGPAPSGSEPAKVVHLTAAQLRAVNGHQPVDRAAAATPAAAAVAAAATSKPAGSDSSRLQLWVALAGLITLGGTAVAVAMRHTRLHRRTPVQF